MAEQWRPAKTARFSCPFITIKAGSDDDKQDFHVHEDIIKEKSEFFRAALNRQWKEGQTRVVELPEDPPEVIAAYVEWLYGDRVTTEHNKKLAKEERCTQYCHLARLYTFGEKIQDPHFCNKIITTILEKCDEVCEGGTQRYPVRRAVQIIYDGTTEDSPARRLMVSLHLRCGHADWIGDDMTYNHPLFLRDLTQALLEYKEKDTLNPETWVKEEKTWFKKC